jgi:hypothetical protein
MPALTSMTTSAVAIFFSTNSVFPPGLIKACSFQSFDKGCAASQISSTTKV